MAVRTSSQMLSPCMLPRWVSAGSATLACCCLCRKRARAFQRLALSHWCELAKELLEKLRLVSELLNKLVPLELLALASFTLGFAAPALALEEEISSEKALYFLQSIHDFRHSIPFWNVAGIQNSTLFVFEKWRSSSEHGRLRRWAWMSTLSGIVVPCTWHRIVGAAFGQLCHRAGSCDSYQRQSSIH